MSFADLLSPETQTATLPTLPYNPTGFTEVAGDTFEAMTRNREPVASLRRYADDAPAFRERNDLIRERFGRDVVQEVRDEFPDIDADGLISEYQSRTDKLIEEGRRVDPDKWQGIRTSSEIEAVPIDKAQTAQLMADVTAAKAPVVTSIAGQLAGGIGAAFVDPINLATLPFGAAAGTGILRAMAVEGLLNAGIEAAEAPLTYEWQKELGHRYGVGDVALDIGTAGVGGAALTGIIRGAAPALRATRDLTGSVSMRVLDRISSSDRLPSSARNAAQYMSRVAHVDEGVPVKAEAPTTREELVVHRETVQETQDAIRNFREPEHRIADLENRLDDGNVPETTQTPVLNEGNARPVDRAIADERFSPAQSGVDADLEQFYRTTYSTIRPTEYDPTAHGSSLILRDGTVITGNGTIHEEMAEPAYKQLGLGESAKGEQSWDMLQRTGAVRIAAAGYDNVPIVFDSRSGFTPEQGRAIRAIVKKNPDRKLEFWDKERNAGSTLNDFGQYVRSQERPQVAPTDADLATRPVNAAESLHQAAEETQASLLTDTETADFARLLKDKPDMTLLVDGEERALQQIADEIAEGETIMAAIRTCGIG